MSRGMKLVLRDPRRQNKDQRHEVSCRERNFINFLVAWYSNTPQFTTHFTIERDLGVYTFLLPRIIVLQKFSSTDFLEDD